MKNNIKREKEYASMKKDDVVNAKQLTEKQKVFAMEFLKDFNATQACIRAGYSKKTDIPVLSCLFFCSFLLPPFSKGG